MDALSAKLTDVLERRRDDGAPVLVKEAVEWIFPLVVLAARRGAGVEALFDDERDALERFAHEAGVRRDAAPVEVAACIDRHLARDPIAAQAVLEIEDVMRAELGVQSTLATVAASALCSGLLGPGLLVRP